MPSLIPVPNIRSQIERAGRAYMIDCDVGLFDQFSLSHDYTPREVKDKDGNRVPIIDLFCVSATEEVKHSRVESWTLRIDPEWDAVVQPNDGNPNANRVNIDRVTGLIMAAMSQTDNNGENFRATALMISVFGRRLAVLGEKNPDDPQDLEDNADMATFYCTYVEYQGALGTAKDGNGALVFKEQRNFVVHACNLDDDSIFPKLTFDGAATLNWTFTPSGVWPEPAQWVVEKSADGYNWGLHEDLQAGSRTSNIAGTGNQFWRVTRSDETISAYMPESNLVRATSP